MREGRGKPRPFRILRSLYAVDSGVSASWLPGGAPLRLNQNHGSLRGMKMNSIYRSRRESTRRALANRRFGQHSGAVVFRRIRVAAVIVAVVIGSACSSGSLGSDDQWMRGYLDDPDRVWAAIHLTLDELGYEVDKENRVDGEIRAAAVEDRPNKGVVLKINQVMRTDVVRVYVHAGETSTSPQPDIKRLDAAAGEFLALLDTKLKG